MKNIKGTFLYITLLFVLFTSQAQESLNTVGGDATGNEGSLSYTVGQVNYTTNTSADGNNAQGVQQAYEIYTLGIEEPIKNIRLTAYPIPTEGQFTLYIERYSNEHFTYKILSIRQQLVQRGNIKSEQTNINIDALASATYIMSILNSNNRPIKHFKIIKE